LYYKGRVEKRKAIRSDPEKLYVGMEENQITGRKTLRGLKPEGDEELPPGSRWSVGIWLYFKILTIPE